MAKAESTSTKGTYLLHTKLLPTSREKSTEELTRRASILPKRPL